jgi:threonine/homoserine/homoserine lactone efflux protein
MFGRGAARFMLRPMVGGSIVRGALLALSLAAPPGPVNVAQLDAGLARGWAASLAVGLGATAAIGGYALLALAGAGELARLPAWRPALRAAGALVLAGYGLATLRSAAEESRPAGTGGAGQPFVLGLALGALNPMALVMVLAVAAGAGAGDASGFLLGFVSGMTAWNAALAAASGAGGRALSASASRVLRLLAGLVLLGYAAHFAGWALGRRFGR